MIKNTISEFNDYRSKMNDKLMNTDNKIIKRIFNLDANAFKKEFPIPFGFISFFDRELARDRKGATFYWWYKPL